MMTKLIGVVVIAAGVAALWFGGIPYTTREKVLEIGPVQATAEREKTIPVPPYVGATLVGIGTLMVLFGGRGKK